MSHHNYVNLTALARIEGWLLLTEALFMLVPCCVSLFYESESSVPFLICVGITAGAGTLMTLVRPKSKEMGRREAFLLTGLTWVVLSLFGMLPFILYGVHMSVTDAFFEAMSGFTTSGASALSSLEGVPNSILLWRCLQQWYGGLGILLFTLAVVPMLNSSEGLMIFNAEVPGITHDKLQPRVSSTAKGLWGVYIVLTIILVTLLSFSDMDFFNALCYGLSTVSTGGFCTSNEGVASFNTVYVKTVMTIFMFLGGVNFSLLFNAVRGKTLNLFRNTTFKVFVWVIAVSYLLLTLDVLIEGEMRSWQDVTIDPLFQAVSMISTTGTAVPGFKNWGALSWAVILALMITGSCSGSTTGGAKIDRFIVLFKFIKNEFYKMMHPSAVTRVILNGKGTSSSTIYKTLVFLAMYFIVTVTGGAMISLSGLPLHEGILYSLLSISNTSLETGLSGASVDYYQLAGYVKWLLAFIMLVGRLEIFTVLLLFTRGFWKK